MICGYEWETDSECDSVEDEDDHGCQGEHSCCLQQGHKDLEHECDCGDVLTDPEQVEAMELADDVYRNNDQAMTRCLIETLE